LNINTLLKLEKLLIHLEEKAEAQHQRRCRETPKTTAQKYMPLLAGTNGEWIVEGTTDKERAKQLLAADFTYQLTTPD